MFKKALLIAAIFVTGSTGFVRAQAAKPVPVKRLAHMRIVYLKDRIENQRERVTRYLAAGTLTGAQADSSRMLLDSVENKMKDEHQANGTRKTIAKETYEAYNATLDSNSAMLNEQKQYFYYYGPYADSGPYYDYYYDEYAAAGSPASPVNPRIYELRDRLKSQRARIQTDLDANTLTSDQSKTGDGVLNSVESQMKDDFATNGTHRLTMDQYAGLNAMLDANSAIIQESRRYFYYYDNPRFDPDYDQVYTK